jgi:hypothetical protein
MKNAASISDRLSGFKHRFRSNDRASLRRRRANRRSQLAAEVMRLEERWMLSTLSGNQIPRAQVAKNVDTPVTDIFWNGGVPATGSPWNLDPNYKDKSFLPPAAPTGGAMKTVTLTNNSPEMIYPFIRGENIGKDPNANPGNQYYDPLDVTGQEYREYIGYQIGSGEFAGTYIGLPSKASITFQVPLVLWDGDNMYIATDPNYLTATDIPYVNVYNYNQNATISIAKYTGQNSTEWVTNTSNYPPGYTPVVVFYRTGTPKTVLPAAPAQLLEWTFRDPYLKKFINDPLQTYPLLNYDASYVNNLTAPVSMEANNVPIYYGNNLDENMPPTYYRPRYAYGWNPTDGNATQFETPIKNFVENTKGTKAYIGAYFGNKGWPEYYNPNPKDVVIPSGANVFLNSPLTNQRSPYDQNYYLLTSTSNGAGPIRLASIGATYAEGKIIHFSVNYRSQLQTLKNFIETKKTLVLQSASQKDYPVGTEVTGVNPEDLTITLEKSHTGRVDGGVYDFGSPVDDYAVTDITKLWYSWANYYVTKVFKNYTKDVPASADYKPSSDTAMPQNEIILTSDPEKPLLVGMTVKAGSFQGGIRGGTTILSITNSKGEPIESATQKGDIIHLSLLPIRGEIPPQPGLLFRQANGDSVYQ